MSRSTKIARQEAAALREAVLEGYDDILHSRVLPLEDNLRSMIEEAKKRDREGWQ